MRTQASCDGLDARMQDGVGCCSSFMRWHFLNGHLALGTSNLNLATLHNLHPLISRTPVHDDQLRIVSGSLLLGLHPQLNLRVSGILLEDCCSTISRHFPTLEIDGRTVQHNPEDFLRIAEMNLDIVTHNVLK